MLTFNKTLIDGQMVKNHDKNDDHELSSVVVIKVGVDKVALTLKVNLRIYPNIRVTSSTQFLIYLKMK